MAKIVDVTEKRGTFLHLHFKPTSLYLRKHISTPVSPCMQNFSIKDLFSQTVYLPVL